MPKLSDFVSKSSADIIYNLLNGTSYASGIFTGRATGAIGAGELCTLSEGGAIRRVNPVFPLSAANVTGQGPTALAGTVTTDSLNTVTTDTSARTTAPLRFANGNYVSLCGQNLSFFNAVGAQIKSVTLPYKYASLAILSNDNVVATYAPTGASGTIPIYAQIFTNAGAVAVAQFTAASVVYTSSNYTSQLDQYQEVVAAGGYFHLAWMLSGASGSPTSLYYLQSFTNAGVAYGPQVSTSASLLGGSTWGVATTSDTASNGGVPPAINPLACANGDVVLPLLDSNGYRIVRYNAGALKSTFSAAGSSSTFLLSFANGGAWHALVETGDNQNVAFIQKDVNGNWSLYLISPSGTLVATIPMGAPSQPYYSLASCPAGFVVASAASGGGTFNIAVYNGSGGVAVGSLTFTAAGITGIVTQYIGTGYLFLVSPASAPLLIATDLSGAQLGSTVSLTSQSPAWIGSGTDGNFLFLRQTQSATPSLQWAITPYRVGRSSVLGVAYASAADGAAVTILCAGNYPLPASQPLLSGATFDNRTAAVPGCRGTVSPGYAALFGLV